MTSRTAKPPQTYRPTDSVSFYSLFFVCFLFFVMVFPFLLHRYKALYNPIHAILIHFLALSTPWLKLPQLHGNHTCNKCLASRWAPCGASIVSNSAKSRIVLRLTYCNAWRTRNHFSFSRTKRTRKPDKSRSEKCQWRMRVVHIIDYGQDSKKTTSLSTSAARVLAMLATSVASSSC